MRSRNRSVKASLKVDFDAILDQSAYSEARSMSGPTFAGLLLNYPCVYRFTTERMDDAARLLSTLDLQAVYDFMQALVSPWIR
jgi:hypothetical protein